MGNLITAAEVYRDEPLKDITGEFGGTETYKYGACRVTGWRKEQEDKMVCIPKFYKDFSFFAVYDGHGGDDAAEYLRQNFHKHLIDTLHQTEDEELAIFLAFLTCDLSLREITEEELSKLRGRKEKCKLSSSIKNAMTSTLEHGGLSSAASHALAGSSSASNENNMCVTFTCPDGESHGISEACGSAREDDGIPEAAEEADSLPEASGSAGEDDSMPGASGSAEEDCKPGASGSVENYGSPGAPNVFNQNYRTIKELFPKMVPALIAQSETLQNLYKLQDLSDEDDDDEDFQIEEAMEDDSGSSNTNSSEESSSDCKIIDNESNSSIIDEAEEIKTSPLIGPICGSTATVVLLNESKLYVANVGDSRCIASVSGKAVVLSKDHSPEDSLESYRIKKAGHKVTRDGRIDSGLNMSRSFGDYGLKMARTAEVFQAVSCEPDIKVVDVSHLFDFIVIASDGIWNAWEDQDVVDFIKEREEMDLEDICAEMFEVLIPSNLTDDGAGCDNMTMIIVQIGNSNVNPGYSAKQSVVYRYPRKLTELSKVIQKKDQDSQTKDSTEKVIESQDAKMKKAIESVQDAMESFSSSLPPLFQLFFELAKKKEEILTNAKESKQRS